MLLANKVRAPAKAGPLATLDVVVPDQNNVRPEKTFFFQALQIPTRITKVFDHGILDITFKEAEMLKEFLADPSHLLLLLLLPLP